MVAETFAKRLTAFDVAEADGELSNQRAISQRECTASLPTPCSTLFPVAMPTGAGCAAARHHVLPTRLVCLTAAPSSHGAASHVWVGAKREKQQH